MNAKLLTLNLKNARNFTWKAAPVAGTVYSERKAARLAWTAADEQHGVAVQSAGSKAGDKFLFYTLED